jgi:hypothetical protein
MGVRLSALLVALLLLVEGPSLAQDGRASDPVVPDEAAFFAQVRENLVRAQRATPQFAYRERRTRFHTNPFGRLGTDGEELLEVFPSVHGKLTYRRVLMRDGTRLTADELATQDREYRARTAGIRRRLQNETAADRRRRLDEEARARRRSQAMIEDIVGALDVRVTGRTFYEGEPAITVAFTGRPAARPKTREGKIAQDFVGTAWVHESLHEVMHVEGRTTDEVSFGFGMIARLNKDAEGSLTRQPIEPGLWMPTAVRVSGDGRAVLQLRKLMVDFKVDWFDYHRYDGRIPGIE